MADKIPCNAYRTCRLIKCVVEELAGSWTGGLGAFRDEKNRTLESKPDDGRALGLFLGNSYRWTYTIITQDTVLQGICQHYRQRRQHELSRSIRCAALAREYWIRHAADIDRTRHSAMAVDVASIFGWGFVLVYFLRFDALPEILHAFQAFANAGGM